jgi:hypothetical protein
VRHFLIIWARTSRSPLMYSIDCIQI